MPGKSSRRWASRFYHRRAALVMTRAADAPGQGRMRQHETAAFPPGLQAGGPQIGERGVGALPAGDEPGGGKPASAPALERRQRLRLPDRGLPVVRRVAPPARRARPGCRPASRAPACRAPARCARAARAGLAARPTGLRNRGWARRPADAGLLYSRQSRAVRAGLARWPGRQWRRSRPGPGKPPRARVSWSRYRRAALPLTKTTMS